MINFKLHVFYYNFDKIGVKPVKEWVNIDIANLILPTFLIP